MEEEPATRKSILERTEVEVDREVVVESAVMERMRSNSDPPDVRHSLRFEAESDDDSPKEIEASERQSLLLLGDEVSAAASGKLLLTDGIANPGMRSRKTTAVVARAHEAPNSPQISAPRLDPDWRKSHVVARAWNRKVDTPGRAMLRKVMRTAQARVVALSDAELNELRLRLLPGEEVAFVSSHVSLLCKADSRWRPSRGTLVTTTYRLHFVSKRTAVDVPLSQLHDAIKTCKSDVDQVKLYTHDVRALKLTFERRGAAVDDGLFGAAAADAATVYTLVHNFMGLGWPRKLFAFACGQADDVEPHGRDGWALYRPADEFARLGVPSDLWTLSAVNMSFRLCATYPGQLCVPRDMTPDDFAAVAKYRSKGRLPVMCWRGSTVNGINGVLMRCSQPLVGLQGRRSEADSRMITSSAAGRPVRIMDMRPRANALANRTKGGGHESVTAAYGPGSELHFMGIENIHAVRQSYDALASLMNCGKEHDDHWLTAIDQTGWLRHIRTILAAARDAAGYVAQGDCVVCHCSDGWDRTSQVVALAELLLDPYYRTQRGFCVLVEKEWLSFGHKFAERHGQRGAASQISPIFLQFLDCVWQLLMQFPCSFEFSAALLTFLAHESYNCRYGTFIGNSEQERLALRGETNSIWTHVLHARSEFVNVVYRRNPTVLDPVVSGRGVRLWEDFFQFYDPLRLPLELIPASSTAAAAAAAATATASSKLELAQARIRELEETVMQMTHMHSESLSTYRRHLVRVSTQIQRQTIAPILTHAPVETETESDDEAPRTTVIVPATTPSPPVRRESAEIDKEQERVRKNSLAEVAARALAKSTLMESDNSNVMIGGDARLEMRLLVEEVLERMWLALERQQFVRSSVKFRQRQSEMSDVPPSWIPDSWSRQCFRCRAQFSTLRRKHHCRHCGNIFCARCSSQRSPIPKFNITKLVRVCDACYSMLH